MTGPEPTEPGEGPPQPPWLIQAIGLVVIGTPTLVISVALVLAPMAAAALIALVLIAIHTALLVLHRVAAACARSIVRRHLRLLRLSRIFLVLVPPITIVLAVLTTVTRVSNWLMRPVDAAEAFVQDGMTDGRNRFHALARWMDRFSKEHG